MDNKTITHMIELVQEEEKTLIFESFNHEDALNLGLSIKDEALRQNVSVAIDIRKGDHILFHYAMEGTAPDNDRWIKMKSNTVQLCHKSSYLAELEGMLDEKSFADSLRLNPVEYANHGGSFPLRVRSAGIIGAITVSGLPSELDHKLLCDALKSYLKK